MIIILYYVDVYIAMHFRKNGPRPGHFHWMKLLKRNEYAINNLMTLKQITTYSAADVSSNLSAGRKRTQALTFYVAKNCSM